MAFVKTKLEVAREALEELSNYFHADTCDSTNEDAYDSDQCGTCLAHQTSKKLDSIPEENCDNCQHSSGCAILRRIENIMYHHEFSCNSWKGKSDG
jgi:hypothetical protein